MTNPNLRRRRGKLILFAVLCSSALCLHGEEAVAHPLVGADETTPSRSHYFSWIDNTNEGSTEHQTLANLDFFKWLHDDIEQANLNKTTHTNTE